MKKLELDNDICHLTFSHTDCSDVWKLYIGNMSEYFNSNIKHYFGINEATQKLPKDINQIYYNEKFSYPKRLLECLESLTDYEYVFFDHEDMFLYDYPDLDVLSKYYTLMREEKIDHIRLIKGGDCRFECMKKEPTLYMLNIKSKWIFSIQPSFWKINTLIEILKRNINVNIWELEVKSQKVVRKMKLRCAFSYRVGKRRGLHHFDNDIYPYVATAIGKGKWNLSEYGNELRPLLHQHDIDPSVRGWF